MTDREKTLDIIFGRWRSQILYAGVKLGVFKNGDRSSKQYSKDIFNWMYEIVFY